MREILPWTVQYTRAKNPYFSNEPDVRYAIYGHEVLCLSVTREVLDKLGPLYYAGIDVSVDNWVDGVVGVWRICE